MKAKYRLKKKWKQDNFNKTTDSLDTTFVTFTLVQKENVRRVERWNGKGTERRSKTEKKMC
jgi:hypothetical protein